MTNLAGAKLPPSIEGLQPLLASTDIDRVAALAMALVGELSELSERVARLEGADPAQGQARIAQIVERVLSRT